MEKLKKFVCKCEDCGMKYEITYNDANFLPPVFCAGCGSYEFLKILSKEDLNQNAKE